MRIQIIILEYDSSLYRISQVAAGSQEQWGGVLFDIGEFKSLAFFQTRKVAKNFKKSMLVL